MLEIHYFYFKNNLTFSLRIMYPKVTLVIGMDSDDGIPKLV
jgi:hypothetical protein